MAHNQETRNPFDSLPNDAEAQSVLTDFIDYTEYLPADLRRSYALIEKLDSEYHEHVHDVDRLTKLYGTLPTSTAKFKPDPIELARDISIALAKAKRCRENSLAEAKRIHQVVKDHKARLIVIKAKLGALPKPGSRESTPPLVEPNSPKSPLRSRKSDISTAQKLKLTLSEGGGRESGREKQSPKKISKKVSKKPSKKSLTALPDPSALDVQGPSLPVEALPIEAPIGSRIKTPKLKPGPKPGSKILKRKFPGNSQGGIAGISTSHALAKLTPPPDRALPGSRHRPWFKLSEYEIATLRKAMKKSAVWSPSDGMVRRELDKDSRGLENFEISKTQALIDNVDFLDEEPVDGSNAIFPEATSVQRRPVSIPAAVRSTVTGSNGKLPSRPRIDHQDTIAVPRKPANSPIDAPPVANSPGSASTAKPAVEGGIYQAATKSMRATFETINNLFKSDPLPKNIRKRKRGSEEPAEAGASIDKESATPASASKTPLRKQKSFVRAANTTTAATNIRKSSPVLQTVTTTITVPLAPEGHSSDSKSRPGSSLSDFKKMARASTATSDRPRRATTVYHQQTSPSRPSSSMQSLENLPLKYESATSKLPEARTTRAGRAFKAASAEPPSRRGRGGRHALRRMSANPEPQPPITSKKHQKNGRKGAAATAAATDDLGPRRSGRRAAPGLVMLETESDGRGKVVKGHRKSKPIGSAKLSSKAAKKGGAQAGDGDENSGESDEETYCFCGDVSYGTMLACDNDLCDKSWFHLECLGLKEIPVSVKKSKWYCSECQTKLNIDEKGQNLQTLSGRRINRVI